MGLAEMYYYLFVELSFPLTREWPFVSSLFPTMLITVGYVYFIFCAGPRYMKNRPPFKLRTFVLIYNVIQILANLWFVKEHVSAGWITKVIIFVCRPRHIIGLDSMKIFNMLWWIFFLKLFDYVETCVFVLRKKQNQISFLHVYHHVSNVLTVWYYLKYILDERVTFITLFNCAVHVIMYIYYFIAAWSPELQQMIYPIKPFITKLQMVQFIVLIIIALQCLSPNCDFPRGVAFIFIGNLSIFLYLFYDFYKKNYTRLPKQNNN